MPIENDDIILNKIAMIQRGIKRALEEFNKNQSLSNYTEVDALILNLERACQAAIDLGMHLISKNKLGMPQSSSDAFRILESNTIISAATAKSLIGMVGFRNIAIHEYQKLNIDIIQKIMRNDYLVFGIFCKELGFEIHI
ncbi:hypothetical protein CH354_15880 [Leptospira levettii]|uniref:type VII toxin-antitoxin system HepT family RNase toxin n=1 Tax=Leptospira levettii TaxID=2023178 RepID=UPI000C2AF5DE|nr:DUF86 domain-containing protein [Leptospira levettii]PJZ36138.1 hypothetical protein CH354_15880 [Leptospira levettii]PJZ90124.1 hypothetical protein CH368_02900 [Leptospira levettii]PJZ99890.1 hypothetical protein CH369_12360 [Leptospira levettii]